MQSAEQELLFLRKGLSDLLLSFRNQYSQGIDFLVLLPCLTFLGQLEGLCNVVNPDLPGGRLDFRLLDSLLSRPPQEFHALLDFSSMWFDGLQFQPGVFNRTLIHRTE
jgi:hypothetical protein